jgi:carbon-monoxide dehydrogenase medium subunit
MGVKPRKFSYVRAGSVAEVVELLDRHGEDARILAGGQSLMPTLNMRLSEPKVLIDINRIEALKGVSVRDGVVRIGAVTRHAEVMRSQVVAEHLPLIAEALPHVAHVAVRNRGTFGGSIALADPAAEMPACAMALGAMFVLESAAGRRSVAADDYFKGLYDTERRPDELLVEALVPIPKPNTVCVFMELARRHGDFAIAGVAFQLQMEGGAVDGGRLVYFGSEEKPTLAKHALAAIEDKPLGEAAMEAAVAALDRDLAPMSSAQGSTRMRLHLQRVLTRRALAVARERAGAQAKAA